MRTQPLALAVFQVVGVLRTGEVLFEGTLFLVVRAAVPGLLQRVQRGPEEIELVHGGTISVAGRTC